MDIYCPKCGEPCDNDELHYEAENQGTTYAEVSKRFREIGCTAIEGFKCNPRGNSVIAERSSVLFDLLGDDMDGSAAMMDDARYMFGEDNILPSMFNQG